MKTVRVAYHRDGDCLIVGEMPWPVRFVEWVFGSLPGWLVAGRLVWPFTVWNAVLSWCDKYDRELLRLPLAHGCDAAAVLWGAECWCDDDGEV